MERLSTIFIAIFLWSALVIPIITLKLWFFGSISVSAVKAISDDCGKRYPVEVYVINGNWFCSEGVE